MADFIPIEFQKAFDKTRQTAITITATYAPEVDRLHSVFGGLPYWESGVDVPLTDDDLPPALLAQINFAELPRHDDIADLLPQTGILQFFIPKNDDYYGANLDDPFADNGLIVRFWESPDAEKLVDWTDTPGEEDLIPVNGAHRLHFSLKDDYAGIDTIECAQAMRSNPFEILEDIALNEKEETQFFDAITDFTASHGHKMLGYPYFVQEEPRQDSEYRLLLQIDTDMDGDNDIMWGDNGVGQLFIRESDLRARRFDNIWYNWDCC